MLLLASAASVFWLWTQVSLFAGIVAGGLCAAAVLIGLRGERNWFKHGLARLLGGPARAEVAAEGVAIQRGDTATRQYAWERLSSLQITVSNAEGEREKEPPLLTLELDDGRELWIEDDEALSKLRMIYRWVGASWQHVEKKAFRFNAASGELEETEFPL